MLAGAAVAGGDAGQLQIERLEGRQLQQEAAQGLVEAAVHRVLEIGHHLAAHGLLHHGGIALPAGCHAAAQKRQRQRVAAGVAQDGGQLRVRQRHAAARQQLRGADAVQRQIIGDEHPQQSGELERCQPTRQPAPAQQHEAALHRGAQQGTERLLPAFRQALQLIQQQHVPCAVVRREIQRLPIGGQLPHAAALQQCTGRHGLAEAAGRAEQRDAPPLHGGAERLRQLFLNDRPVCHARFLPFAVFSLNNPR